MMQLPDFHINPERANENIKDEAKRMLFHFLRLEIRLQAMTIRERIRRINQINKTFKIRTRQKNKFRSKRRFS